MALAISVIVLHSAYWYNDGMSTRTLRVILPKRVHSLARARARRNGMSFSEHLRHVISQIELRPVPDRGDYDVDTSVVIGDEHYEKLRNLADRMGGSSLRAALLLALENSNETEDGSDGGRG